VPEGSRWLRLPEFKTIGTWRWSALRTDRLYLPGNIPGTHFCSRLSRCQCHRAARRIMSMKNSTTLPTCNAVAELSALPRDPYLIMLKHVNGAAQNEVNHSWTPNNFNFLRVKNFIRVHTKYLIEMLHDLVPKIKTYTYETHCIQQHVSYVFVIISLARCEL